MSVIQSLFGAAARVLGTARLSVDEEIRRYESSQQADIDRIINNVLSTPAAPVVKPRLLKTSELLKHYGEPGDPDNLEGVDLPFPLEIAWTPGKFIKKMTFHKKCSQRLYMFFQDVQNHYGLSDIRKLEIDQFGGGFNFRAQRGLEKRYEAAVKRKDIAAQMEALSRHSWAFAFDLSPEKNGLKVRAPKAQFSRPEYKPMIDAAYRYGFIGYGIERGNDWMHFEIGVIL